MVKEMKFKREGIILSPKEEIGAIFNPAAAIFNGRIILLARAVPKGYSKLGKVNEFDEKYVSNIMIAESDNGKSFDLGGVVIGPDQDFDRFGCEDPRISKINEKYVITYTSLAKPLASAYVGEGIRISAAVTDDFKSFKKIGRIGPDIRSKAGFFFPEKINGKNIFIFKNEQGCERMQIAISDHDPFDEEAWKGFWESYDAENNIFMDARQNSWEGKGVEPGPPPIRTEEGWLLVYSAISSDFKWSVGAALLDLDDPSRIIARSKEPLLEPEEEWELKGDVNNVVFPEGLVLKDGNLMLYYGAADKFCALATIKLMDILNHLKKDKI